MKISEEYEFSRDDAYAEYMRGALLRQRPIVKSSFVASSVQSASTQAILDRPESEDAKYRNRPILNWQAVPNAKSIDKAVAKRDFDATQVQIIEDHRRKSKNSIGDAVSYGDSGMSKESRSKAIDSYMYSQGITFSADLISQFQKTFALTAFENTFSSLASLNPEMIKQTAIYDEKDVQPKWFYKFPFLRILFGFFMPDCEYKND